MGRILERCSVLAKISPNPKNLLKNRVLKLKKCICFFTCIKLTWAYKNIQIFIFYVAVSINYNCIKPST